MSASDCQDLDRFGSSRTDVHEGEPVSRYSAHLPGDCRDHTPGHWGTPAPMAGSLRSGGPCPGRPRVPPACPCLSPAGAAAGRTKQAGKAAAQGAGEKTGIEGRAASSPAIVKPGTRFLREWQGEIHEVQAIETGDFIYGAGRIEASPSSPVRSPARTSRDRGSSASGRQRRGSDEGHGGWLSVPMRRCAIYVRKSSEEGLDMSYNSLEAQADACAAYIASQRHEGWTKLPKVYEDGGYSGGNMDRPGLSNCCRMLMPARSTSSSSTRSTG